MKKILTLVVCVALLVTMLCGCAGNTIQSGYTGVKIINGVVQEEALAPGRYGRTGLRTKIVAVNNQRQSRSYTGAIDCESSDRVEIYVDGFSVTYQIVPDASLWIVKNIGFDYEESIIPTTEMVNAIKKALANISAEQCTNRSYIGNAVCMEIQNAVNDIYYDGAVKILSVAIKSMSFEENYNKQLNAVNELTQKAKAAELENQMKRDQAQAELEVAELQAEKAIVEARGKAEVALIEADNYDATHRKIADADVYRLTEITKHLTDEYIQYTKAIRWNGVMPTTITGDGVSMFLN